ncbi:hypothetical protein GIB67_021616 [Kingdonia uniflora]|uniref:Uncharacterized protein n=1 Tax=Kingdonia uniflora TaxID=39325 RepID=A0A7J7MDS0_9MAGN|nr:hypothetical protein GIB67_021616 [Kingdonia uniflora]
MGSWWLFGQIKIDVIHNGTAIVITGISTCVRQFLHIHFSITVSAYPAFEYPVYNIIFVLKVNSEARKYKTAPLQHRDLLEKLFEGLSATGDFAWSLGREPTPGSTSRTPMPQVGGQTQSKRKRPTTAV